ncbi:MAG: YcxB family protein [bacterium]|nr:YcxB family protein [bacterium]
MIQIEYTMNKKHLRMYMIERLKGWGIYILCVGLLGIGVGIWAEDPDNIALILGMLVFLVVIAYCGYAFLVRIIAKNSSPTDKWAFNEDGIHHATAAGTGIIYWTAFKKWQKKKHFYYLKRNMLISLNFPVESIPAEKRFEFEDLLKRKIGK